MGDGGIGGLVLAAYGVVGLLVAGAVGLQAYAARARRRREAWKRLARRYGGHYLPEGEGIFGVGVVEGNAHGMPFRLDGTATGTEEGPTTRLFVPFALGYGPVFALLPQSVGRSVLAALGAGDVRLGHGALDDAFVIRTRDAPALRAHIPEDVRAVLPRLRGAVVRSDGGTLEVRFPGHVSDTELLADAIDAATRIASTGRGLLDLLAGVPGVHLEPSPGTLGTIDGANPVTLHLETRDETFELVARAARGQSDTTGAFRVAPSGDVTPPPPAAAFDGLGDLLLRAAPCRIDLAPSRAEVAWPTDTLSRSQLDAGLALLGKLATASTAAYR